MSREVRRVPLDWQHPKSTDVPWSKGMPVYVPLLKHQEYVDQLHEYKTLPLEEYEYNHETLDPPDPEKFMPDFSDTPEDQLGWCMYECTSEGTPKTPVFTTPEELARYCAEEGVTTFGSMRTASYEQWLKMIHAGWAFSAAVTSDGRLISGVEAITTLDKKEGQ